MTAYTTESDARLACDAHRGTSHVPEDRGRAEVAEAESVLAKLREFFEGRAESEAQRVVVRHEWPRFVDTWLHHWRRYLDARSRCLSPMITGPSGFNVRRNERAFSTERKRFDDWQAFVKKARAAVCRRIADAATPEQVTSAKVEELRAVCARALGVLANIADGEPWDRAAFVNSAAGIAYEIARWQGAWWAFRYTPTGAPGDCHCTEIGPFEDKEDAERAAYSDMDVDYD